MAVVLSLDIGTSKLCAMAFDPEAGQPLAALSAPNSSDASGLPSDWHEQDPIRIRERCWTLLRSLLSQDILKGAEVLGIGITGQMHGLLLVDESLRPLTRLITWRDGRTASRIEDWRARLGAEAPLRLGCRIAPGYGGATLAWLAQERMLPARAKALSIADFLAASLCGLAASEPTHAASWGLLNLAAGDWDADALHILGIPPAVLPALQPSCRPLGILSPEAQQALSLGASVRVCSPLGDNQASVIGLAGLDSGALVLNLGTGGQISRPRRDPAVRSGLETRPMPFGGYIQVGASLCGGWSYAYLEQFYKSVARELCGVELEDGAVYARMNAWAQKEGETDLRVDPRFSGTRQDAALRGSITGIDTHNLTPAALTRAMAAGIVQELFDLASETGMEGIERIIAAGNAVRKNPALPGIISARFGLPCSVSAFQEEAALGAALSASLREGGKSYIESFLQHFVLQKTRK